MSKRRAASHAEEFGAVQRMLARERLSIDDSQPGRTTFLSHVGAQPRLLPGPWVGHRDLIYALALANISPQQRTSLARAVLVEYEREFGIGHLQLEAVPSGLPLGGSSLKMRHRTGGPTCLHTWALGPGAKPVACDWLLLRAQPEWALVDGPPVLRTEGLEMLAALGGEVVVLVATATGAIQIARSCAPMLRVAAHPRFAPHIEGHDPDSPVLLWPHDALEGAGLRGREITALVLVDAPESTRREAEGWCARHDPVNSRTAARPRSIELVDVTCPGRLRTPELAAFWRACGEPSVLVRGDAAWVTSGAKILAELGAAVEIQPEATQLELL
jgi:hypothetical protein